MATLNYKNLAKVLILAAVTIYFSSCRSKQRSPITGWEYNNPKNGGFDVRPYGEQETGPGLVLIEGGTFTMGRTEQDVLLEWDNINRRVTVASFYMDETEVRNLDYLEYLYWLSRVYIDYPEVYKKALPDTLVWRERLGYNEPYVEYYFRHPAYRDYPVVGINWVQANEFCRWRTDRVNEFILIREGILEMDPNQQNENNFNTEAYLSGQYDGVVKQDLPDLNPNGTGTRKVNIRDGLFLPAYRLPTEVEWEYASVGLIGNTLYERIIERRIYPWNGHVIRSGEPKSMGEILANTMRGRGDYMGVAGNLNDAGEVTTPVFAYWPNDYGLYNMAGNVSEWVLDAYRPLSFEDVSDFRPYRGNVYQTRMLDDDGNVAEKDSLGRIKWRNVKDEECVNRRNYRYANNIDYMDGDQNSSLYYATTDAVDKNKLMYEYGVTSMVNNAARVYKGASWKDRVYWAGAGTRRYLDELVSTNYLGFRCAMTRVGSPIGNYGR